MSRLPTLLPMLEASPNDSFLLFAVAKEYESAGDDGHALSYYQKLQHSNPNYVGMYYHLGKLQERMQTPEAAVETYKAGILVAELLKDNHAKSELVIALEDLE